MSPRLHVHARGFTLVETLVAIALVASAAVALAQLVALGRRQTSAGRDTLQSAIAAQGKLEELRAITWSHTVPGSDVPLSPPNSLTSDVPGFSDWTGPFLRRWGVVRREPLDADVVVMTVCVFGGQGVPPGACVVSARAKQP